MAPHPAIKSAHENVAGTGINSGAIGRAPHRFLLAARGLIGPAPLLRFGGDDASHNSALPKASAGTFRWSGGLSFQAPESYKGEKREMVMALALEINMVLWLMIGCATAETVQLVERLHWLEERPARQRYRRPTERG
jgi:hypothetical protein